MNIRKWIVSMVLITVCLGTPIIALSGSGYELKCENKECNYAGNVKFGGGKAFEQITGYCLRSGKFVYLPWKRGTKKPDPMGNIWDHHTGKIVPLYKSPDCFEPFIPIESIRELKYCPKCNQPRLKIKETVLYD